MRRCLQLRGGSGTLAADVPAALVAANVLGAQVPVRGEREPRLQSLADEQERLRVLDLLAPAQLGDVGAVREVGGRLAALDRAAERGGEKRCPRAVPPPRRVGAGDREERGITRIEHKPRGDLLAVNLEDKR